MRNEGGDANRNGIIFIICCFVAIFIFGAIFALPGKKKIPWFFYSSAFVFHPDISQNGPKVILFESYQGE